MLNQVREEVLRGVQNSVTGCSYPGCVTLEMLSIVFRASPIINSEHGTLYAADLCAVYVFLLFLFYFILLLLLFFFLIK